MTEKAEWKPEPTNNPWTTVIANQIPCHQRNELRRILLEILESKFCPIQWGKRRKKFVLQLKKLKYRQIFPKNRVIDLAAMECCLLCFILWISK